MRRGAAERASPGSEVTIAVVMGSEGNSVLLKNLVLEDRKVGPHVNFDVSFAQ
ncbi:MAG: hypothetical protein WAM78_16065 [Candidatus Sulfotelmatobacter sp.]